MTEEPPTAKAEIPILHLDDDLVVLDKPPGLSVHRGPRSKDGEEFVLQRVRTQIDRFLYPVHRLDHNTSGVMTFALSKEMAANLQERLSADDSEKRYLVLVRGDTPDEFESDRQLTGRNGELQDARTAFRTLARFNRTSLLEAKLYTGRMHQIRRHLDHCAHQVIGDSTHGKGRINKLFRERFGLPRMFLHAWKLKVRHPRTDEPTEYRAPLAADLRRFLCNVPDLPSDLLERV